MFCVCKNMFTFLNVNRILCIFPCFLSYNAWILYVWILAKFSKAEPFIKNIQKSLEMFILYHKMSLSTTQ